MRIHVANARSKMTKCKRWVGRNLWWISVSVAKAGGPNSYDCPACRKAMKPTPAPGAKP